MRLNVKVLTYGERAKVCRNSCVANLFKLMEKKKSNLSLAADVTTKRQLLELADLMGPEICVLKTHIDIIEDFDAGLIKGLKDLAEKHQFMIFEDRKFADIGNTSKMQYQGGMYRINEWSHMTNAHVLPGPGIITGLAEAGLPLGRGLLLLAEMSSEGSLAKGEYIENAVEMAREHRDFVMGFIARGRVDHDPSFITMTPGVKLSEGRDGLGQQYLTPQRVIIENRSDVIIVGRDIILAADPLKAARQYRNKGWDAYLELLQPS